MPDPSDPTGAYPINRLVAVFKKLERRVRASTASEEVSGDLPPSPPDPVRDGALEPYLPIEANLHDRGEVYRAVYAQVRIEIKQGMSPKAIRAGFVEMVKQYKGVRDTILKAINDALDGRAPRL